MLQISSDPRRLDLPLIHAFLSTQSGWASGISFERMSRATQNSLNFGGYLDGQQVAYGRVISDYATFANLVDVFVLPEYRGRGYSMQLLAAVMADVRLQGLRRFTLTTSTAAGLYAKFGFTALATPEAFMERYDQNVYR